MRKTRTFIAVVAEGDVHAAAQTAIRRLQSATENVKWVAPENLHWTLQFLGDLDDAEVADVCQRVLAAARNEAPFVLNAYGVGAFPNSDRPRVLWLGAREGRDAFCKLHAAIDNHIADLGLRGERRRFVPHVTLGRVGRADHSGPLLGERLAKLADFDGGAQMVSEVVVFASELTRRGPAYHRLAAGALDGSGVEGDIETDAG